MFNYRIQSGPVKRLKYSEEQSILRYTLQMNHYLNDFKVDQKLKNINFTV